MRTNRTLIVDDEPTAREGMRRLLATDPEVRLVGECSSGREAVAGIRDALPDLVFLDVRMPDLEGFAVLRQAGGERIPAVVFVADCERDALRAFEVNAVDYVLKPFTEERFRAALERAKQRIHVARLDELLCAVTALPRRDAWQRPRQRDRLPVRSNGTVTLLPVREIEWIDAEGDSVRVHAGRTSYLIRETMKSLEDALEGACFVRIHRSTIVNLDKVKELQRFIHGEYVVVLVSGTTLKLSRGYRERLEAHLGRAL